MAKFRFRLENLLKIREAERDRRRAELAQAFQAEKILRNQDRELDGELADLRRQSLDATQPGAVNAERLLDTNRYQLLLRSRKASLGQQAQTIAAEIERRRNRLAEADQQVRILEKLRERQQAAYTQMEFRREMKQIDEFAQRCRPMEVEQ